MEILGMSIAIAAIVAAVAGVGARNIIGWLKNEKEFNVRHAAASAGVAVIVGIPVIVTAFSTAFEGVEAISEQAQLVLFITQVASIAGFDALAKGAFVAAAKK